MERSIKEQILNDLDEKMVFLAGPRQVGKTTLSKSLFKSMDYMNWDTDTGRMKILQKQFQRKSIWIFDEIHKYKSWRNYLKGLYDHLGKTQKILVTGSAKLDVLRKGGDSLQGRYHFLRLLPLTYKELQMSTVKDVELLLSLSGFPEPFFLQSQSKCNRWSRSYRELLIRQEVASNEQIVDLGNLEIFFNRLTDCAGGILSINSFQEDMQISHKTLSRWLTALERLYAVFRLMPFGPPKVKAHKKGQKLFFYDWNAVSNPGARFENFLAVHLLKWVYFEQDVHGRNLELRYYRDKYEREVDFVILEKAQPILFIEAKLSETQTSKGLIYLKSRYPLIKAMQVHLKGRQEEYINQYGIYHRHVMDLLNELI